MYDTLLEQMRFHARFPGTGRRREDLWPNLRSFIVRPYVVFCRPVGESIEVLRVLHQRRDIDRAMRESLGRHIQEEEE
jgi:toxin ParE1/3/4